MKNKNVVMMIIAFAALIVVFVSRACLRRLEADQAQMRTEVNERIQDEEFRQQVEGLRESQQNLSQQISEMVGGNIADDTAENTAGQQRGPIDVNRVTYVVYPGGICHVDMYILTPDLHVQKYSINPESDKNYDYLAGELPSEDRYEVTEYEMSDLQWTTIVNILTRVNFMELDEDMSTKDTVDDGSSYYIRVETAGSANTSGGYAAGIDKDADSRRFAEARQAIENAINTK